jgi:hypothetical protein
MATPTGASANQYATAFKKNAGAWGAETAVDAASEILVLNDGDLASSLKQDSILLKESNNTTVKTIIAGAVTGADPAPKLYMRYEMGALGTIWAMVLGTAGAPDVSSDLHKHTFQQAASRAGLHGTYASEYPGKIFSAPSAKPIKFTIGLQDGILIATPTLRCSNVIDDSGTNGASQLDLLTGADQGEVIKFGQNTKCYLATFAHPDAMAATEAVAISGFEITYDPKYQSAEPANGQTYLSEPFEADLYETRVKLDLVFATDNSLFFDDFKDGTAWQLLMEFTSAGYMGASDEKGVLTFYFPKLQVAAVPDTKKAGQVKTTVEFIAVEAAAEPVGMTLHLPYVTLICDRSTDFLA